MTVSDEDGHPVPSATVSLSFSRPGGEGEYSTIRGTTGADGLFRADGISCWDVVWRAEKKGYYSFSSNLVLRPFLSVSGKDSGRWFRSPYPLQAILAKKGNPHEMRFHDVEIPLPAHGETVGFDCLEGLPTPPHGKGKRVDVEFSDVSGTDAWKPRSRKNCEATVRISFPGPRNGGRTVPVDPSSESHSPRFAPDDGFSGVLESTVRIVEGKYSDRDVIPPDQYILFRIRNESLPDGTATNGLFGKMRGYWEASGPKRILRFKIWTNDEPGNRNLEDTSGWW
ncbi:MAG: carboxypeptidase regulatory-like domain-containing protein [Kiritimatiellae bacterium]|nr:carboxypeptidase regulatory-like domain-containing protein [Kiritimatiellia bacterium]